MKINIYYGGRGVVDDPTIYVLGKIENVLKELNVEVNRYNLYDMKNQITALSQSVTETDAVILATTVEWLGMGGYMQMLLDSCWLYADKQQISKIYMFPVVMSKTYGEKEVSLTLVNSWEMLGGKVEQGLCAYVYYNTEFEFNKKYAEYIEKYAENIYRTISQKRIQMPSSSQKLKNNIKDFVAYTPQENEQLSKYVSDDTFVKTQKEDIESLASIYKEMLTEQDNGGDDYYINVFNNNFQNNAKIKVSYMMIIEDKNKSILINVDRDNLSVKFGEDKDVDIICKMNKSIFDNIIDGKSSFHKAFMTGQIVAKGDFRKLQILDEIFVFK